MKISNKLIQNGWKFIGEAIGTSQTVSLPDNTNINELCVIVTINNNDSVKFSTIIPFIVLTDSEQGFRNGYTFASDSNAGFLISVTKSKVKLTRAVLNNGDVNNNTKISVYYR